MLARATLITIPWLLLLAGWYGIHYSGLINPSLVPTPHAVAARFVELMQTRLPLDILMSTRRVFSGVVSGILVAVPVGFTNRKLSMKASSIGPWRPWTLRNA